MYRVTFRVGGRVETYEPQSSSVAKWMTGNGISLVEHILWNLKFLDIDIEIDVEPDMDKSRQLHSCIGQILDLVQAQKRGADYLVINITITRGDRKISMVKTITDNMSWYEMPCMTVFLMENL